MSPAGRHRLCRDDGFSLPELLVVILIVGVLAAIGIPAFLGSRGNAHDGDAKDRAGNLARQVEACHVDRQDYRQCDTAADLSLGTLYSWGTGPGQVRVTGTTANRFTVESYSRQPNEANGSQHHRSAGSRWRPAPSPVAAIARDRATTRAVAAAASGSRRAPHMIPGGWNGPRHAPSSS